MSSADRRTAIINAAQRVFVEKGFDRTTTRELAEAAGVSEALLFQHFPNKAALYTAIQMSCFKEEGAKFADRFESLEPYGNPSLSGPGSGLTHLETAA